MLMTNQAICVKLRSPEEANWNSAKVAVLREKPQNNIWLVEDALDSNEHGMCLGYHTLTVSRK